MSERQIGSVNDAAFLKYGLATDGENVGFLAIVDGDPVNSGFDYSTVATVAAGLRSQRGPHAVLSIYDTREGYTIRKIH